MNEYTDYIMTYEYTDFPRKCPHCKKKIKIILKPKQIFYNDEFMIRPEYEAFIINTVMVIEKSD